MRGRITARLVALLAALGDIIGLRSTESDVTFTVEGRWSAKFDPVRLGLSFMVIGMAVLIGVCSALSLNSEEVFAPTRDPTPTPDSGWLEGVEGGPYQIPESVGPGR